MAFGTYNILKQNSLLSNELVSGTVMALLVGTGFIYSPAHRFVSDIVTYEVSGTNYTRQVLTGKSVIKDDIGNDATFMADNPTWNLITVGQVAGVVIYRFNTSDSDSTLIGAVQVSPPYLTKGNLFTIKWNISGVMMVS